MIDTHSHILPGLDDGAVNIGEAVAMARMAVADGIRTVVATPHAWHPMFHVEPAARDRALELLRTRLKQEQIDLDLVAGAECQVHTGLMENLEQQPAYLIGKRRQWLLLEWPDDVALSLIKNMLFEAQVAGIQVLLAHAERHPDVIGSPELAADLVAAGLRLQLSADSLTRNFQWRTKRRARQLLRDGLVYVIASDAHNADTHPPLLAAAIDAAKKVIGPSADDLVGKHAAEVAGAMEVDAEGSMSIA